MNKNTINKLNLIFLGLKNRVNENFNYLETISFKFISGEKTYEGCYKIEESYLIYEFLGEKKDILISDVFDDLIKTALNYDSLELVIGERGVEVVIEANDKNVSTKQREPKSSITVGTEHREYLIPPNKAQKLLKEIGILSKEGKIKNDMIRKYNQIDHFVEVLLPILSQFEGKDSITILDCACGKSYLSFVLNYYIKEVMKKKCKFIGIDISESVIKSSKEIASNLGYKNMEFINEDLRVFTADNIDLVISLHACDVATDYALATAVRVKADSVVVVPCCHKELLDQIDNDSLTPIFKHNILKVRFNDFFTDSLRVLFLEKYGYDVSALEYISPLDTPKNLMIRAIKNPNKIKNDDYEKVKKMFNVNPTMDLYVW